MFSYDRIGQRIKTLAQITFIAEAIAAVIAGLVIIGNDSDMTVYGLLLIVGGPFVAWVSSWLLYGFGELIDKACQIEYNTRPDSAKSSVQREVDDERIRKLEKLRSEGLITEEEYQKAITK